MAVVYDTKINEMKCLSKLDDKNDVVFQVNFDITGTEGEFFSFVNYNIPIEYDGSSQFIQYDQLTKEDVEGWIVNSFPPNYFDSVRNGIGEKIQEMKFPTTKTLPLPWQ